MTGQKESYLASQDFSVHEKVDFLKKKESYPRPTSEVKAIKTHMSWVFLTDSYVYKLKIPFRHDHMQLLSVASRKKNCEEEVRLNKRLAKEFYLGIVPLSINKDGELCLGEGEHVLDWLVKMKRLPDSMMLDEKIKSPDRLSKSQLQPTAELLTRFYLQAPPIQMDVKEYQRKVRSALQFYRKQLLSPQFDLDKTKINATVNEQISFLEKNKALLQKRISSGKIIEGHGDLKPDHICLSPPAIIDCLEFDKNLRILDVYDDLAFLCLECDKLGESWVGTYFAEYYAKESIDFAPDKLLSFYKSYKALTRALLSIRHLKEKQYHHDSTWRSRAELYLKMASQYIHPPAI